jgi:purine-binding chemotaxis protein CheW
VVEGILNLAGQAVTVLRLDALLGVTGRPPGLDASILVMKGEQPFGLLVERVDGVRTASEYSPAAVSERGSFNGCLAAELSRGDGTVHLLSWRRLLLEEERARVAEFGRFAQARLDMLLDIAP